MGDLSQAAACEGKFLAAYAGYFDNKRQSEEDAAIPFSSKLHIPVSKPEVGDRVFFVWEQTDAGPQRGGMQSRLKFAQVSMLAGSDPPTFVAKHLEFVDPEAAIKNTASMTEEECRMWAEGLDVDKDLRPAPPSSDVEFKSNADGHYEVDISYTGCQAGGQDTKTEIKATLSPDCWKVHARISRMPSGDVVRDSVLLLEKKQR